MIFLWLSNEYIPFNEYYLLIALIPLIDISPFNHLQHLFTSLALLLFMTFSVAIIYF